MRIAVVVLPFVPVTASARRRLLGEPMTASAARAAARRPSVTTSCGTGASTGRSTTAAAAPRRIASPTKSCASLAVPATAAAQAAAPKQAQPDLARGQAIATQVCAACHTVDGSRGSPANPILAGQHPEYIVKQLTEFKADKRQNPIMKGFASALSEEDMKDLGAHFAQQTPAGGEADASDWKEGEKLYRAGDKEREIPACIACHGPEGRGNGPAKYPALRAQHAVYTFNQLKAFRDGSRKSVGNDIMATVTERMTDAEMQALASYLQGLR